MLIKPEEKYREVLAELWHEVFGDDFEYINLIFDSEFRICDTFVKEVDGKIVSALYLLNCKIFFEGKEYSGKYLYAAATSPEYRGKGIMGELIDEAQVHCKNEKSDFISLVPANESLYDYYSKFDFKTAMHRYETTVENLSECRDEAVCEKLRADACTVEKYQSFFKKNRFHYCKEDLNYAVSCTENAEKSFYALSRDGYFIADDEMTTVYEFISSQENFSRNIQKMLSCFNGSVKIYSPYDLSNYGETGKVKYGMLYPINEELERDWQYSDIYMNLALD